MQRPLAIYLQDHYAGSTIGLELARRLLRENRSTPYEPVLRELAAEIAEDRATLLGVMTRLEVAPARVKDGIGWLMEKVGRLKLNGQILGYAPLSRLLELEGLSAGIAGKRSLWLVVGELESPALREFDFAQLAERATSQLERIEPHRSTAAKDALSGAAPQRQASA